MAERLLWLPPQWISPETIADVPAPAAAVAALRERFELEVLRWPSVKGGPAGPPTWQAAVELVQASITNGCHVVATAPASALALLALSGPASRAGSFIANELALPDATLEKLGIHSLAAASAAGYRTTLAGRWVPAAMREVSSDAAESVPAAVDYAFLDQYMLSWESLDLLSESPHLTLPSLYIDPPLDATFFPEGEARDVFLRFVPDAEVKRTERWGNGENLSDPRAGQELAGIIIEFVDRLARGTRLLTVLFTDIVDSTVHAVAMGDQRWARLLSDHHALVRRELAAHGGHEVDNAGDGFLATFDSPARAVRCAAAIVEGIRRLGLEVRAGVHTGECEVVGDKVGGAAVHAGARIATAAVPGEVLVSQPVRDLVAGSDLQFESARTVTLKGLPGEWQLHSLAAV